MGILPRFKNKITGRIIVVRGKNSSERELYNFLSNSDEWEEYDPIYHYSTKNKVSN